MMKSFTGFSKKPVNCLHEFFFAFIITIFLVLDLVGESDRF